MKLTNPTDDQLKAAFAEYVAGWANDGSHWGWHKGPDVKRFDDLDDYPTDANALLPFFAASTGILEFDGNRVSAECEGSAGWKEFSLTNEVGCEACAWQGVRCMCIALLLSRGVEVEFTE